MKEETFLSECPFCDSQAVDVITDELEPDDYIVYCEGCGAKGPVGSSTKQAAEKWNTRVDI